MDNGRNHIDRTMLGTGESPDPVRLWWARRDDDRAVRSVEISGLPVRHRVEPAGLGSEQRGRDRVRRGQRRPARLAPGRATSSSRSGVATGSPTPAISSSTRTRASSWSRTGRTTRPCAGRWCAAPCGRASRCSPSRPPLAAPRCAPGCDQLVVLDLDTGEDRARCRRALTEPGLPVPGPRLQSATCTTSRSPPSRASPSSETRQDGGPAGARRPFLNSPQGLPRGGRDRRWRAGGGATARERIRGQGHQPGRPPAARGRGAAARPQAVLGRAHIGLSRSDQES